MSKKNKKIIGRNRSLNLEEIFKHRDNFLKANLWQSICQAFSDPEDRKVYIEKLLHGLDTEPIMENGE